MDVLDIELENCYGIRKLKEKFTFRSEGKVKAGYSYSIYAPNGFMKTSLARTFLDIQEKRESQDLIFPDRPTTRTITSEPEGAVTSESVFVVKPYVERYSSANSSTLLVNPALREKYESAVKLIEETLSTLLQELKKHAGIAGKTLPTAELKEVFKFESIYDFFSGQAKALDGNIQFSNISYSEIFNDKTFAALKSGELSKQLKEYIGKYQELVDQSPVLSKKFNPTGAGDVSKSLVSNGFFEAHHSLNVANGESKVEITSAKELDALISKEKERILGDKELTSKFEAVDKQLQKNAELKRFRDYLAEHPEILPELGDFTHFREKLWLAYFNLSKTTIDMFHAAYESAKDVMALTAKQAQSESTKWASVVAQFNDRFYVPFKLFIHNQKDVILKGDAPNIGFEFDDGRGVRGVDEEQLLQVLSQGEKRALYILNILFEVHARRESQQPTIFIIDDIADSFDYKNKYAIIEYLNEISKIEYFRIIFLTHNFDFHRTISSRLGIARARRLFVKKQEGSLSFIEEKYQNDPFLVWKGELANSATCLVASIPFVRNLAEYCHGKESAAYETLTSLLHIKPNSENVKVADLQSIYRSTLLDKSDLDLPSPDLPVIQIIFDQADALAANGDDHVELEVKVTLSIGIRLKAEQFMISKIADGDFVGAITKNQTLKLYEKYAGLYSQEENALLVLSQVNLMTPENIHLNSFMYEPILDMSALHLYDLYNKVKALA
ncbi:hypothetical protein [Zestomonas carbonaria]|uniref:Phage infection protein n=1 Tax=Zestomonas carbonaria TaxID=2762745 RepID=A0A7U7EPU4_9GAMM|nr:hypothetical protein [Pseudomonas carbonaria]CAD5108538.1 hypothetical protein PSEWESI4_02826 [Pseudomonas carbonaria]